MRRPHRCAVMIAAVVVILVGWASVPDPAVGAPVAGNLVVTGGHGAFTFNNACSLGFSLTNLSGAGFALPSLFFETGSDGICGLVGRPGDPVPGSRVQLLFGHGTEATILGVHYVVGGDPSLPGVVRIFDIDAALGLSAPQSTTHVLPPIGGSEVVFTEPFSITNSLIGRQLLIVGGDLFERIFDLTLDGTGLATLTFVPSFDGPCSDSPCAWRLTNAVYDFGPTPVPEPVTLLLAGVTAAAVGFARWRRRR